MIRATVVVPTLATDSMFLECLASLERQTCLDFEVVVVDNSGESRVRKHGVSGPRVRVIEPDRNVGFGAAINAAYATSTSPFLATLNDDACPHSGWLEALLTAMDSDASVGMCASRIVLANRAELDSAGMLLCADGSSKQRGHLQQPDLFEKSTEVLLPSACAALYRRNMLQQIGLFDEDFFLYCEDTDLGLRGRWAGWKCSFVPNAVVEHRYSYSAGRASPLKAYYVERNRLFVIAKTFPCAMLWKVPLVSLARYFWHGLSIFGGRGAASEFGKDGNSALLLPWYVLKAHVAFLAALPALWRSRRQIRAGASISPADFCRLATSHAISAREVASL